MKPSTDSISPGAFRRGGFGLALALLGAALLLFVAACDSEDPDLAPSCTATTDCPLVGAEGQLCVDGRCARCDSDEVCEADEVYGFGATCSSAGLCQPCQAGFPGCSCFAGESCASGFCIDNVCTVCDPGDEDCTCRDNGSCGVGLTCDEGAVCRACEPGLEFCPCRGDDTCEGELTCLEGTCADLDCEPGELECPCNGGRCLGGLLCGEDNVCRECTNDIAGCPCVGGLCSSGLLCREREGVCTPPLSCDEVVCLPNQRCQPSEPGVDAFCEESCVPGFSWVEGRCEETVANCTFRAPGSIAGQCAAEGRSCDESDASARCGDCLTGFISEAGQCRPVRTCDGLTCGDQQRDCVAHTQTSDAFCGGCSPGYREMAGVCVRTPAATCDPGFETSLDIECAQRNRLCAEGEDGAACGSCISGFVPSPGGGAACVPRITCADLSCAALGRNCSGGETAACTDCRAGYFQVPGDPDRCRPVLTCTEVEPTCEEGQRCVEGIVEEGLDAICVDTQCVGANQAFDVFRQQCVTCGFCASIEGGTGRTYPLTDRNGNCVCETQTGFFYDPAVSVRAPVPCDEDGDGFVRITARPFLEMREGRPGYDEALAVNARCSLRTIDRVMLINELGQEKVIPLDDPRLNIPEELLDNGVGLYETVRNDSPREVRRPTELPRYGDRWLRAEELNPFTKACRSRNADFSDSGTADLAQHPNSALSPQNVWMTPFQRFAHFVELHRSWYVGPGPGEAHGMYVIEERSRCELASPSFDHMPLTFPDAVAADGYWRGCVLRRDSAFRSPEDPSAAPTSVGTDLALFTDDALQAGCDERRGSCQLPPPFARGQSGAPMDDFGVTSRNYCDLDRNAEMPGPADGIWRGMNLHSLFRCAETYAANPSEPPAWPWYTANQLHRGTGSPNDGTVVINTCTALDCDGAAGCEENRRYGVSARNPASPILQCNAVPAADFTGQVDGRVGWVSLLFQNTGSSSYVRGCVDEGRDFLPLCPTYDPADLVRDAGSGAMIYVGGVRATAVPSEFGSMRCGCGFNYGGPNCDVGCVAEDTFYGGTNTSGLFACDAGYCSIAEDGGRSGWWMCGGPSPTLHTGTDPDFGGTINLSGNNVPIRLTGGMRDNPATRSFMYAGSGASCEEVPCTSNEVCVHGVCVSRDNPFTIR